jgi:hypothetical protein
MQRLGMVKNFADPWKLHMTWREKVKRKMEMFVNIEKAVEHSLNSPKAEMQPDWEYLEQGLELETAGTMAENSVERTKDQDTGHHRCRIEVAIGSLVASSSYCPATP